MLRPVRRVVCPLLATFIVFTGRSLCSFAFAIVSVEDLALAAGGDAFLLLLADALAAHYDPLLLWVCAGILIVIACSHLSTFALFVFESLPHRAFFGIGDGTGLREVHVLCALAFAPIGDSHGCAHRKCVLLILGAMFLWALAIFPAWPSTRAWRLAIAALPVEFVVVGALHVGGVV